MKHFMTVAIAVSTMLGLSTTAAAQSAASEWFPRQDAGTAWSVVKSTSPLIVDLDPGAVSQEGINGQWQSWRHATDFLGLGPTWVHSGPGERIYVWNSGRLQLLVDFAGPLGADSRQVVSLNGHHVTASRYSDTRERRATPQGMVTTRRLHLSVMTSTNDYYSSEVFFARGQGVVGWTDFVAGYDWGLYGVFVHHDVIPPLAPLSLTVAADTRDVFRYGRLLLVVDGQSLQVSDTASGATELNLALEGAYAIDSVANGQAVIKGWSSGASGGPEFYTVDLAAGTFTTRRDEYWHDFGTFRVGREPGPRGAGTGRYVIQTTWGSHVAEIQLAAGMVGTPTLGDDGLLYIPFAYPGSLLVVDPTDGRRVDWIDTGMWLTWAKVVGRTVFTDGPGRVDLDARTYEGIALPGAASAAGAKAIGDHLFVITDQQTVLAVDAAGAVVASGSLPVGLSVGTADVVAVDNGRVLVRLGERLETVDLQ